MDTPARSKGPVLDAGWLLLLSGVMLLAAALLIPASDDLADARWRRDRALAVERGVLDRLERHEAFLAALERGDPVLLDSLAETQLNLVRAGREPVAIGPRTPAAAGPLASLEPPATELPERVRVDSTLAGWATDETGRLWLIAAGAALVMVGLLPPSRASADTNGEPPARSYPAPT
ncbi:MAG: hypothetical protein R3B57_12915 [Phycisphaerales bacterium]